jgi:hypothetical protein
VFSFRLRLSEKYPKNLKPGDLQASHKPKYIRCQPARKPVLSAMQQPGPGQGYHSDYTSSSQYPAPHISRERNEFARMGQEYHAQQLERPQFDPRVIAEPRSRPAAGMDFSSRGSEHSLSQALSSRSPARKCPNNLIVLRRHRLEEQLTPIAQVQKTVLLAVLWPLVDGYVKR